MRIMAVKDALAHQRVADGRIEERIEIPHFPPGVAEGSAAANVQEGALRRIDHGSCLVEILLRVVLLCGEAAVDAGL